MRLWTEHRVDFNGEEMSQRNARSPSMNPPDMLTPKYNAAATHLAKKKLVGIMGQEKFAAFVTANGGFQLANLAKILPPELLRLGAGGLPAAAPAKPAAPSKPATPSKTHQFVPAKPSAPPAKSGARSGALSIGEAEALAGQVFKDYAPSSSVTEAGRWKSLEGVFAAHGHSAPWHDTKNVAIPWPKLVGHAARTRKIASVFQTGLTRAEFSKLSARDQSDFCAAGGIITN